MKRTCKLLITCTVTLISLHCTSAAQYDFCQPSPTGQMLYYQILPSQASASGATTAYVRVSHPEKEWPYYADNKPVGELAIPHTVENEGISYEVVEVGENAFYRCDGLTGVRMSIQTIGTQAFCGCTALKNMDLKFGLETVGEGAFAYCSSLTTLILPESVKHIGISAFAMCEGLQSVHMTLGAERLCDELTFLGSPLMQDRKNRKKLPSEQPDWVYWSF